MKKNFANMSWFKLPARLARTSKKSSVAVIFAFSLLPIVIAISAAVDFSRLADGRAVLQRAVDNAALSGAAAYSENASAFNTLAQTIATSAFCEATSSFPEGFSVTSSSTPSCSGTGSGNGPIVSAVTAAYTVGTVGNASNSACTTSIPASATFTCAFVVTVTASAQMSTILPSVFGMTKTITVTGVAANPFLNFSKIFSNTSIASGAKYANSVWVYPLLLNAQGQPDFTTNPGALPDATTCYGGPDQTTCGSASGTVNYTMLANTEYANSAICGGSCTSSSPAFTASNGVVYVGGVVQNLTTPPGITATTPLSVAFEAIAGGNQYYNSSSPISNPGQYGYSVVSPGSNPVYTLGPTTSLPGPAKNSCYYPYGNLAHATVTQAWQTVNTTMNGTTTTSYTPLEPWTVPTHWFYASYLSNPTGALPPDYQEIQAQINYSSSNTPIFSIPQDPANNGNISGQPTYNSSYAAGPSNCPHTTTVMGITYSNDVAAKNTTYPNSSSTSCSVVIVQSSTPTVTNGLASPNPTPPQYDGSCFQPSATPGAKYSALSCQDFGSNYYFYYWNDMGGGASDNYNYEPDANGYTTFEGVSEGSQTSGDGTVVLHCSGSTHIVLIQ